MKDCAAHQGNICRIYKRGNCIQCSMWDNGGQMEMCIYQKGRSCRVHGRMRECSQCSYYMPVADDEEKESK